MKPTKRFWKNKKVLITGYEGFLGAHLTKRLLSYGAKIVGIDLVRGRKYTVLTGQERKRLVAIKADVAHYRILKNVLRKYKNEYVFHLAAEALVGRCLKNPLRAFSSNIRGTWSLLEACRGDECIQAIVIASSDKAYGSHYKLPYQETYPLQGKHPYDVSKSYADLLANAYFYTFQLPVVITRCGNIYGPGEYNFSRIVPDTIKSILLGEAIVIRSDGNFTRDYIYVEDIVDGYLLLAQKVQRLGLSGEAFNFSTEDPITVLALVQRICRVFGKASACKILNQAHYEIKDQFLSAKKARRVLDWRPKYSLGNGLKKTIQWYRDILKTND